ncbi:MAG: septum formation protein Maf [Pirellulaceae bacterium]|nr:septum formation protein Maf [Pirellulaceae bacterium]
MRGLPRADLPTNEPLILASGSPRRAQLLDAAGYEFVVDPASDTAECGICSGDAAPEFVARNAYRKAADVVSRYDRALVLAADTVAWCDGQILGKPRDQSHAESMLRQLSGRQHDVYTGICLWSAGSGRRVVEAARTTLEMLALSKTMLQEYLASLMWEGKAGSFGYQDGNDWLSIVNQGSESNVVGLPMERLAEILENFDSMTDSQERA